MTFEAAMINVTIEAATAEKIANSNAFLNFIVNSSPMILAFIIFIYCSACQGFFQTGIAQSLYFLIDTYCLML